MTGPVTVTHFLRCDFCHWQTEGWDDHPGPWEDHMAAVHPEYWAKRNAVVAALKGRGTYDTGYPQACGRLARIMLGAIGETPVPPWSTTKEN